jgi:uncharacterized membrane protein
MVEKSKMSVAEQIDRAHQRIALGVLLVAGAYFISVVKFFVTPQVSGILDIASKVLGVATIVLVLPSFLKFVSMRRRNREACREPEGFVIEMFNKATSTAFKATFVFLVFLEIVSTNFTADMPGEFFVKLIMTVTLAVFSVTFFILNRSVKHWEEEGDETVAGRDA